MNHKKYNKVFGYKKNKMATNIVLMKKDASALELSRKLGFSKTLFLDSGFVLIKEKNKKQLLKKIKVAKQKNLLVAVRPESEEILRFALEKTKADLVFGQELINPKDSVHFPKGGLNQVLCKIAKEKEKTIGFSFTDILNRDEEKRSQLLNRISFNLKLCRKYKVKVFLGNFSTTSWEIRGSSELKALVEVLGGVSKEVLEL